MYFSFKCICPMELHIVWVPWAQAILAHSREGCKDDLCHQPYSCSWFLWPAPTNWRKVLCSTAHPCLSDYKLHWQLPTKCSCLPVLTFLGSIEISFYYFLFFILLYFSDLQGISCHSSGVLWCPLSPFLCKELLSLWLVYYDNFLNTFSLNCCLS